MRERTGFKTVAVILLLMTRGVALWIVVPATALVWVILAPTRLRRGISLGMLLGWVDLNLLALLQCTVFRWGFARPRRWLPARTIITTTHRLRLVDPA